MTQQAGLILVKSNAQMVAEEEKAALDAIERDKRRSEQLESNLSAYVRRKWEIAKRHKQPVEQRMLANLRQIEGRYSSEKEAEITSQGLPLIYMGITAVKCRAAKSWIRDVLMPAGDKPWTLEPTPVPSLDDQLTQEIQQRVFSDAVAYMQATGEMITPEMMYAKERQVVDKLRQTIEQEAVFKTERMSELIEDQLLEGGWHIEFDNAISDVVDFPAGILKAPVIRKKKDIHWQGAEAQVVETFAPKVERVDPFNIYPLPGVVNPDDGDMIEYHEWTKDDIYNLIGVSGFDEEKIRAALNDYERGFTESGRDFLRSERSRSRGESSTVFEDETIGGIEFWGSIKGSMLADWGMDAIEDEDKPYDATVILIGRYVVCARLNPDPLGRKPYNKACFESMPNSFWGKGVPDLIKDCSDICNAAARALVANMGISSGPQVFVDVNSIPPNQDLSTMYPWKIWQLDFSKTGSTSRPPIDFFQPNALTGELLKVFEHFSRLADEYSGIPSYTYGGQEHQAGAASTASGLSMLMNAASKAIKAVVKNIDKGIISPSIEKIYVFNMLFAKDENVKGDAQVVARGALQLIAREQTQMRLQELLQSTSNPIDMQIFGMDGRAKLWKHAISGLNIGGDQIIPTDEELAARLQQAQQQMLQQGGGNVDAPQQ